MRSGFLAAVCGLCFMSSAVFAPAFAVSCTEQGNTCKAWAVGQYATYKGKCAQEVGACKARCKKGNKVFIGVLVGNSYPIDTCN